MTRSNDGFETRTQAEWAAEVALLRSRVAELEHASPGEFVESVMRERIRHLEAELETAQRNIDWLREQLAEGRMSADNVVLLVEYEDGTFAGYDVPMSDLEVEDALMVVQRHAPRFTAADMKHAVVAAQSYMAENVVEYGYQFVFRRVEDNVWTTC